MPTKLRKLKITRVAVCQQGANYDPATDVGAHILLFKSATPVGKTPVTQMGMHAEPDGDEAPPLDYRTRGQQYDLWEELWGKWECFCTTFYDCIGDGDADNVPHLPILVDSIGQFQDDVAQLLEDCGVSKQAAPFLDGLATLRTEVVTKAGAPMAGHRLTRFKDALAQLQQILTECTPEECPHGVQPPVDRAGVSSADVTGIPFVMKTTEGDDPMAVRKNTESDMEHCKNCDDEDCDNPAHERMKKEETRMAERDTDVATLKAQLDTVQAELATAKTDLAKAQQDLATLQEEQRIAKMSPDEQREVLLASMPELVRKSYLDQETRLALIEKTNRDLQEKNERLDYIQKTVEFQDLGFVPDDHWEILKAIDQWPEALRTEHLRLLRAMKELTKTSPWMSTVGTHHPSPATNGSGTAEQQLMALAQQYSEEKDVPLAKAVEAVIKAHPDLYEKNMLEKRHSNRVSYGTR